MTLRRRLIRALDRPGGRSFLGAAVTQLAKKSAPGVRVYFKRGMWVHQENDSVFVDGPALDYHPSIFPSWAHQLDHRMAEAADFWCHAWQPRAGSLILDIGAGKGEDTIIFSKAVGPTGKVLAIEAHPTTFRCLRLLCELNHLDNVTPVHAAVVDRAGPVFIETTEGWQGNRVAASGQGAEVPGITLDELVARERLASIDFLKMNIEGAETLALHGMQQTLRITRALCIACHDFRADWGQGEFFRTKAVVSEAVERAGFRILARESDPRAYVAGQVNAVRD